MKPLLLLPFLLLAACASHVPRKIALPSISAPVGRITNERDLRTPEQLKEYRFGRYVDPTDPRAMHEWHPVYRVERSAAWNLKPSGTSNPKPHSSEAATPSISANDAVVAEVNKQRVATRAFTEQASTLNQRLAELSQAVGKIQELAKQNLTLKREMSSILERLDTIDGQLRERRPTAVRQPAPPEDKW